MIRPSLSLTQTRSRARHYEQLDRVSRTEGATPHALVLMLYDELLASLDVMSRATTATDGSLRMRHHERTVSILHALETGLDLANGGDVASVLAGIYARMRHCLTFVRNGDPEKLREVREGVFSLKTAWEQVAR